MTTAARPVREFPIGPFRESATRWLTDPRPEDEHAEPAAAATVMLVRGEPLEVFMIERASTMDFAPSTWVFPGGRVDAQDATVLEQGLVSGFDARALADRLGVAPEAAGAVLVCALRELFEEAGVLLVEGVSTPSRAAVDVGERVESDADARRRLEAHEVTFADVLGSRRLRVDLVAPVDRWVTPPFESRRFDTWFFTALLPDGASAAAVSRESQRGRWVRPDVMLADRQRGDVRLLPPTRVALERLMRAASAHEALDQARDATFEPTRPEALMGEDGPFLRAAVNL